ncbi:MAG: VOC family protein [Thiotrichales bacterium]
MEPLRFRYTILYVDDVSDTLNFYKKAFGIATAMLHESGDYGELETGGTKLSFASLELMKELGKNPVKANPNSPSFEIAFETNDVAAALAKALSAGASLLQEAEEMPWGQTTAYVTDINGFLVELCTPMESQP